MANHTWRDNEQREWNLSLTFGDARNVHRIAGVDLLDPSQSAGVVGLSANRLKLGEVLWLLSKKQAEHMGVTQSDFYDGLDTDALAEGFEVLCEAFIAFCPIAQQAAVRAAVETQLQALAQTATKIAEAINSPESMAAIAEAIDETVAAAKATITQTLGKQPSSSLPSAA